MDNSILLDGYPALIEVTMLYKGVVTYHENLSFKEDPDDEQMIGFVRLIRPTTKQDFIIYKYVRLLTKTENHY